MRTLPPEEEFTITDDQYAVIFDLIGLADMELACVVVVLDDGHREALRAAIKRVKETRQ